jgi:hypothetical protein
MITALKRWMAGKDEPSIPARIFWVGLALRVAYLTLAHTFRLRVILDHFEFGWEMGRIARSLATGQGFSSPFDGPSGPTAWTPPLYPLLLAGVFKVFGVYTLASGWVILTINSVFSAATGPAVYEIAQRCFRRDTRGRSIALWSGWLWALYPAAMQYAVHWVWDMALTAFLFSWIVVLALRVRQSGRNAMGRWALFGVLWGLVALSNSSLLIFLPFCGLWMIWPALNLQALRHAALSAICCLAVLSPWAIRNWLVFHAFVPMRANLGAELYQSMLPDNQGFPWGPTLPIDARHPEFLRYRRMGEVAYSAQQGARAKAMIRQHPSRFAAFTLKRADMFWAGVPHPIERSLFTELVRELNFAFASVASILGLGLALVRRIEGAWLFFWAFVTIPMPFYLITVQARFRHPLEPIMLILIVFLFQSAEPRGQVRA